MGEPSKEEYKIQCFDAETQQLLKTALKGEHGEPLSLAPEHQRGTGPEDWADPGNAPPSPFTF